MKKIPSIIIFCLLFSSIASFVQAEPQTSGDLSNISASFSSALDKEVQLPETAQFIAKLVLGVKKSPTLTITLFVVLACLWLVLFLILANTLDSIPFFNSVTKWIGAAAIATIIALSGVLESFALFLLALGRDLTFFEKWQAGQLAFVIILIIALFVLARISTRLIRHLKHFNEKEKAREQGFKSGTNQAYTENRRKAEAEGAD